MKPFFIDPVIFSIGPLQVRWYGLMYVIGFFIGGLLLTKLSREKFFPVPKTKIDMFITFQLIGMFLGARIAYVTIYNWDYYSRHLDELFAVWKGGLSFHGAIVGFVVTNLIYSKVKNISFFKITDSIALAGTQGLFFGRIGNFINGELYGRPTDLPWGVVFPGAGPYPRHPSQLYEAFLEGIVLSLVLWFFKKRVRYYGILSAIFFIGYGIFRYFLEFLREPDAQLGYYFGGTTTMGQILCLIMILIGISIYIYTRSLKHTIPQAPPPGEY